MSIFGIDILLGILGGDDETENTISAYIGKKIKEVYLDLYEDKLKFRFTDGTGMCIYDDAQHSTRYMTTADDLTEFTGSEFLGIELKSVYNLDVNPDDQRDKAATHCDIEFLDVKTSEGTFQISNHNEHNGYYAGFRLVARPLRVLH